MVNLRRISFCSNDGLISAKKNHRHLPEGFVGFYKLKFLNSLKKILVIISILLVLSNYALGREITPSVSISGTPNNEKNVGSSPPRASFSGEGANDIGKSENFVYYYYSEIGDPIKIMKTISPVKKEEYRLGDPIRVSVEIENTKKNSTSGKLKGIQIVEIVDDDLRILSPIKYSVCDLNKITKCKLDLYREDIDSVNDNLSLSKDSSEAYLFFCYNNISNTSSNKNNGENARLLKNLHDYFDVNWAESDKTNIYIIKPNNDSKDEKIFINNTLHKNYFIEMILNNSKNYLNINISNEREYNLIVKNESGKKEIFDWNDEQKIFINELASKDKIIYSYYINPKKRGIFNIETIVHINDSTYSAWPDTTYPMEIEIKDPDLDFNVISVPEKYQTYPDEWPSKTLDIVNGKLCLKYYITYLGDSSNHYCDNIRLELQAPETDVYYYTNENDKTISDFVFNLDFSMERTQIAAIYLRYNKTGIYNIPGITINGEYYNSNDKLITVKNPLSTLKESIELINVIISAIIGVFGFLFGLIFDRKIKSKIKEYRKSIKRIKSVYIILIFISFIIILLIILYIIIILNN